MQNMLLLFSSDSPPRVHLAGLRSNAAVDMFGRWAAVTLSLFSSCNAQHAVPRNTRLRLCWSYANNVPNNLPQPWHSVPRVCLSVLFIADVRDERRAIFNLQTTRARTKNTQKLLQHIIKKLIQRQHSRIITKKEKFLVQTMYFTIYSMLFLEDKAEIEELCANLQSTMAVEWNMHVILLCGWGLR